MSFGFSKQIELWEAMHERTQKEVFEMLIECVRARMVVREETF